MDTGCVCGPFVRLGVTLCLAEKGIGVVGERSLTNGLPVHLAQCGLYRLHENDRSAIRPNRRLLLRITWGGPVGSGQRRKGLRGPAPGGRASPVQALGGVLGRRTSSEGKADTRKGRRLLSGCFACRSQLRWCARASKGIQGLHCVRFTVTSAYRVLGTLSLWWLDLLRRARPLWAPGP